MDVFLFDLMPYPIDLDPLKVDGQLPLLTKKLVDPEVAAKTYRKHMEAWLLAEKLGFGGVAVNEHHCTPYGLMNSPNIMAAALSQYLTKAKIAIYGNLLPIHNPLRLAEEIAMLDCLTNGRLIAGIARGAPREHFLFNVPVSESRARFEECFEILKMAWTEESFSYEGKYHSYKDVAIWPRPLQQPHPEIWVPSTGSRETVEWAAKNSISITPGHAAGPMREDTIRLYSQCMAQHGRKVTPRNFNISIDAYIADSKEKAVKEYGKYYMYFFSTLVQYGHVKQTELKGYTSPDAHSHLRFGRKGTMADESLYFRPDWTEAKLMDAVEHMAWGTPDEVADAIIQEADEAGAQTVLLHLNRGVLPHDMFIHQIRRMGEEVLPRLQKHNITNVRFAEVA